jgi:HK97 family phage major capsid protein
MPPSEGLSEMNLPALREARAAKVDALKSLVANAEGAKRDLSDLEQDAFDTGKKQIEALDRDIQNAEFLAEAERRAHGETVNGSGDQRFDVACREFSLRKAIASQIPGMNVDAGREIEVSRELEHRSGRAAQGMLCPTAVFEKRVVTFGGSGANIVGVDWRPDQFIDRLRDAMIVRRLGARVLDNLQGNVEIPRLTTSATSAWVAENAAITPSDPVFDKISLTPKHVGVITEYSRNMILQSSPDIEDILRDDFAAQLGAALDRAAINGGGSNEPVGILTTSGIGDVPGGTNGLAPTYLNILLLISAVANANALTQGNVGFLTNYKVVTKAATVLKSAADTSSSFIIPDPGVSTLAGFPLGVSNLVPSNLVKGTSGAVCSALIFGAFSELMIGYWSQFDLLVNPYESTAYSKGNVLIRGMLTADIKLRHAASFAATKDILTT